MPVNREHKDYPMTTQQELFCLEYIKDGESRASALRAGYSPKSAGSIASRLLNDFRVRSRIAELMDKKRERTHVTIEKVVAELARVGFSDIKNYVDDRGQLRDVLSLDSDETRAIASIKVVTKMVPGIKENGKPGLVEEKTMQFTLHNKMSAADMLLKHLGGYPKERFDDVTSEKDTIKVILPPILSARNNNVS